MLTSTLSALLCIISINSFHLSSALDNIRKKVGTPENCFTVAKTADLILSQYAVVPLIEFINVKVWSFSTYSRTASMKLVLLKKPAFNAGVEIVRIATLICLCLICLCLSFGKKKKIVICITSEFLTKMQKPLVEICLKLMFLLTLYPVGKRWGLLYSSQIYDSELILIACLLQEQY